MEWVQGTLRLLELFNLDSVSCNFGVWGLFP